MVYCLSNIERSPVAYTLDPTEHMKAWRHAERSGWTLTGVFHSHTHTAAYPSKTDVARALEPQWTYWLVSLEDQSDPEVRAFRIRDGEVDEETVAVTGQELESQR